MKYEGPSKLYPNSGLLDKLTAYVYDLDSLKTIIGTVGKDQEYLLRFINSKQPKKQRSIQWCEDNVKKFFEEDHTKTYGHYFSEHAVPLFTFTPCKREQDLLILNPCMKDLQFFKMLDPFTAFQEISMYISGVLGVGEPNTVQINDVEKARKHGFDKGSFRTPTPGKKANRWK